MTVTAVSLSDRAYQRLIAYAQRSKYVEWGSKRVKGLSIFLNDLSTYEFQDTRPEHVKQRHQEEISHGHAPSWRSYSNRRLRALTLSNDAVQLYFFQAYRFGIIKDEPYVFSNVPLSSPLPAVGYVLEGIGLEWITPDGFPIKPVR